LMRGHALDVRILKATETCRSSRKRWRENTRLAGIGVAERLCPTHRLAHRAGLGETRTMDRHQASLRLRASRLRVPNGQQSLSGRFGCPTVPDSRSWDSEHERPCEPAAERRSGAVLLRQSNSPHQPLLAAERSSLPHLSAGLRRNRHWWAGARVIKCNIAGVFPQAARGRRDDPRPFTDPARTWAPV
jgi:hypothetical protein